MKMVYKSLNSDRSWKYEWFAYAGTTQKWAAIVQAYLGDTVSSVPDPHNKVKIAIKLATQILGFLNAYKSYVYTSL